MRRLSLCALACVFFGAVSSAAAAPKTETPVTETAAAGNVSARLDYTRVVDNTFTSYEGLKLTISRGGTVVTATAPRLHPGGTEGLWPGYAWQQGAKSVHVSDLDGDGEPEVSVDLNTGGAHCCAMLWAYRWNGSSYVADDMETGSSPYTQRDLDHDGKPEWVTADPRFEYLVSSFAGSGVPIRIYDFKGGKFAVVTTRFPALIKTDVARWWKAYQQQKTQPKRFRDARGFLAAWAADECMLGRSATIWPALQTALRTGYLKRPAGSVGPSGSAVITKLRKSLRSYGYLN